MSRGCFGPRRSPPIAVKRVVEDEAHVADAGHAVGELVLGRTVELAAERVEVARAPGDQHPDDLPIFLGALAQDLPEPVALAELALRVAEDLVELADLRVGVEAEVGAVIADLRELAVLGAEEVLLDVAVPAERLEDPDRPLRVEHALGEAGEDLLVRAPRAAERRRRDARDRLVAEAQRLERRRTRARRRWPASTRACSAHGPRAPSLCRPSGPSARAAPSPRAARRRRPRPASRRRRDPPRGPRPSAPSSSIMAFAARREQHGRLPGLR